MTIARWIDAVVALVLLGVGIAGTFVVSGSGVLFGVFPMTVPTIWLFILSGVALTYTVLSSDRTALWVSALFGVVYAALFILGLFLSSFLGFTLQEGNLWLHLGVALVLLYDWLLTPTFTSSTPPGRQVG